MRDLEKSTPTFIGQEAPKDWKFCPLAAVTNWPYKFFQRVDSETIARAFFAAGKFRMRGWTLYYIHTLLNNANKPLILIPATEVQALFDDIKRVLRLLVYFPDAEKEPGFVLSFTEKDTPLPRYLGRLDLEHNLSEMEAQIPPYNHNKAAHPRSDSRSFAAFKKKMEAAIEATKQKSKAQKDRKKRDRINLKHSWCEEMKRTQCYLGIRPRMESGMEDPSSDLTIEPRELGKALQRYNLSQCIELPDVDTSEPAPFPFYKNVVFICVDVEAYEKMDRPITEVGISTLDTNDLTELPPGEIGKCWMNQIRSRHFRIKETAHLINSEFVAGCADQFEPEFGQSEWLSSKDAPQVIASCFRPPYSRPEGLAEAPISSNDEAPTDTIEDRDNQKRQLILVGHDITMDINYLRRLGYDVSNLSNLIESLDTANLYRAWKHEQNPSKLGAILALIGIALSARKYEAGRLIDTGSQRQNRVETLEREVRERAKEEADEWAAADQDGGDGGAPKPLERFGWPTPETVVAPMTSGRNRRREQRATVQSGEVQGATQSEAAYTASPFREQEDSKAEETTSVVTFPQCMSERLAMFEKQDGDDGGARLACPSSPRQRPNSSDDTLTRDESGQSDSKMTWWKIKLFEGMTNDVKRRSPYYWSDWKDAWDYRVVPATVYMYFAKQVSLLL
ncbi:MAG: hypothetical protein Q9207_002179 [Kuettlingeria erythrocarpa]